MPVISTEIYIDGTLFLDSLSAVDVPYEITSTGIEAESEVWTYSGTGTFLGFSTTQGATTPDEQLAVGDDYSFVAGNTYYLYTVEATTSTSKMYFGTSNISKMYFGQNEVSKVYFGQDLVYEKQASGFTVHLKMLEDNYSTCTYAVNDESPIEISKDDEVTLTNVTKLVVYLSGDENGRVEIGTSYGDDSYGYEVGHYNDIDITSYLHDGCYVSLYAWN